MNQNTVYAAAQERPSGPPRGTGHLNGSGRRDVTIINAAPIGGIREDRGKIRHTDIDWDSPCAAWA